MTTIAAVVCLGTFCGVFCGIVGTLSIFGKQMESLMPTEKFLEDLAKLMGFERDSLVKAGVIDEHDAVAWTQYCESPAHFILSLKDNRQDRLLRAMNLRLLPGSPVSKR